MDAAWHRQAGLVHLLAYMNIQQAQDDADIVGIIQQRRRRRALRRRRVWVRQWLDVDRRLQYGHYHRLMPELRYEDPVSFFNFLRVPPDMFDELLNRLGPRITKQDTRYRKALEPGLKLAMTLRHLASGDKYASMKFDFRVPHNTMSVCVRDVCQAIIEEYKDECIQCPTTVAEWREISEDFRRRWNVPHACGAIDGKHVACRRPRNSGSLYFNYKGFFSIVLLGLVDADYKFLWLDVGGYGHMSDAQIFNASELKECLEDNSIGLPAADPLPNDDRPTPYYILGDDAFGLRTYMMKPYAQRQMTKEQRIFNYRLSRGRRVVENAFGILAQRWQVLLTTMQHDPPTIATIVETSVILHNLMRMRYPALQNAAIDAENANHQIVPGLWRDTANMHDLDNVRGPNRDSTAAKKQREYLRLYFNSAARSVPWQDRMVWVHPEQSAKYELVTHLMTLWMCLSDLYI